MNGRWRRGTQRGFDRRFQLGTLSPHLSEERSVWPLKEKSRRRDNTRDNKEDIAEHFLCFQKHLASASLHWLYYCNHSLSTLLAHAPLQRYRGIKERAPAVPGLHRHISAHQISDRKHNHSLQLRAKHAMFMSYLKHFNKDLLNPALFDVLTGQEVRQNHLRTKEDDTFMDSWTKCGKNQLGAFDPA